MYHSSSMGCPLKPNDFVIVLKNGGPHPEVAIGTVITMYTKNTMHDWIQTASSVGTPSYIYVSIYRHFTGAIFSSMACDKLWCPTVLQIPRTHLLFSLASFPITRQEVPTTEGYPHTMATLCPASLKLFQDLQQCRSALNLAVKDLGELMKGKIDMQVPFTFTIGADSADEEVDDNAEVDA
ncbi:hypothetical protein B0H19DRAFT_1153335 [Mycena capillaripes]|nr:hypothetical protein B0H19DRAFT_1153335 [Mycena capillaripes]